MRTEEENGEIIEISEDFRIPGTNVILEEGDRIEVFEEEGSSPLVQTMSAAFKHMDIGEILASMIVAYQKGKKKSNFKAAKEELTDNLQQFLAKDASAYF